MTLDEWIDELRYGDLDSIKDRLDCIELLEFLEELKERREQEELEEQMNIERDCWGGND